MRKSVFVLLALVLVIAFVPACRESPEFEADGLKYLNTVNNECNLIGIENYENEVLTVPKTVSDYTVTGVYLTSDGETRVKTIITPDSVSVVSLAMPTLEAIHLGADFSRFVKWSLPELKEITVSEDNALFYAKGNCLVSRTTEELIKGSVKAEIPSSVKTISEKAFYEVKIDSELFVIPQNVSEIGNCAFAYCDVKAIFIPESVTEIGYRAFYALPNTTIYCEREAKPDGWDDEWVSTDGQYKGCKTVIWGYKPTA